MTTFQHRTTTAAFRPVSIFSTAGGQAISPAGQASLAYCKLGPADRADIAAHLSRLSDHDRRLRFMGYVSREVTGRYAASMDWGRSVVIGCTAGNVMRGIIHLAFSDPGLRYAEIGLSVEAGFRNRGIGAELIKRSLIAARNRSAKAVLLNCLSENMQMRRIAERLADESYDEGGEVRYTVRLDPPDLISRVDEAVADYMALFRRLTDTTRPERP